MNFKKFISGVSALTIAASAFAGMAVTANAATATYSTYKTGYYITTEVGDPSVGSVTVDANGGTVIDPGVKTKYAKAVYHLGTETTDPETSEVVQTPTSIGTGNRITVSFYWNAGNATSQYSVAKLLDSNGNMILGLQYGGAGNSAGSERIYSGSNYQFRVASGAEDASNNIGLYGAGNGKYPYGTVTAVLNMDTKIIESLTYAYQITNTSNSGTVTKENLPFYSASATNFAQVKFATATGSYGQQAEVSNFSVSAKSDTVTVNVADEDQNPVSGATVNLGTKSAVTGSDGKAVIAIVDGTYDLTVEKVGYEVYSEDDVAISADTSKDVTLTALSDTNLYNVSFTAKNSYDKTSIAPSSITVKNSAGTTVDYSQGLLVGSYTYAATCDYFVDYSGSFTVTSDGADVEFEMTPATYSATVATNPFAMIKITGTSTVAGAVDTTVYSDKDGNAAVSLPAGASYTAAITKGGYTGASTTFSVTADGASATKVLSLADTSDLYYEDFNSATNGSSWITSGTNTSGDVTGGKVRIINSHGNTRTGYKSGLNIATDGTYKVSFDYEVTKVSSASSAARMQAVSFRDSSNKVLFGLAVKETASASGEYELYAYSGSASNNDSNNHDFNENYAKKIASLTDSTYSGAIVVSVNTLSKKVIVKAGENDAVTFDYSNNNDVAYGNAIASIRFTTEKGSTTYIDNLKVTDVLDPEAVAELVEDNITDDENYEGDDADPNAVYSVFQATVTAGDNAVKKVKFTLNNAAKSTTEYTSEGFSGSAIFALIVPMASANVTDITAVIDGASYAAYTVE